MRNDLCLISMREDLLENGAIELGRQDSPRRTLPLIDKLIDKIKGEI